MKEIKTDLRIDDADSSHKNVAYPDYYKNVADPDPHKNGADPDPHKQVPDPLQDKKKLQIEIISKI